MSYPQPYKQLIAALIAWGIDHKNMAVSGGFARDTKHGVAPSDLDVVITQEWQDPLGKLSLECILPDGWAITSQHETYDDNVQRGDFDSRLAHVVQLKWTGQAEFDLGTLEYGPAPTLEADLLVATSSYRNPMQHVLDNDFNLNHYMILPLHFINDEAPIFVGECEGTLVQCRTSEVSYERHNRMVEKAKVFGWHSNLPYKGN